MDGRLRKFGVPRRVVCMSWVAPSVGVSGGVWTLLTATPRRVDLLRCATKGRLMRWRVTGEI